MFELWQSIQTGNQTTYTAIWWFLSLFLSVVLETHRVESTRPNRAVPCRAAPSRANRSPSICKLNGHVLDFNSAEANPGVSNVTCLKLGDRAFNLNRSAALSRRRCISTFFYFHRWHLHRLSHHLSVRSSPYIAVLPLYPFAAPAVLAVAHAFIRFVSHSPVSSDCRFLSIDSPFFRLPLSATAIAAFVWLLTDSATTPVRKRASP